jgi:hypothetical protein
LSYRYGLELGNRSVVPQVKIILTHRHFYPFLAHDKKKYTNGHWYGDLWFSIFAGMNMHKSQEFEVNKRVPRILRLIAISFESSPQRTPWTCHEMGVILVVDDILRLRKTHMSYVYVYILYIYMYIVILWFVLHQEKVKGQPIKPRRTVSDLICIYIYGNPPTYIYIHM